MPDALARVLSALRLAVPGLAGPDAGAGPGDEPGTGVGLDGTALAEALWLAARMAEGQQQATATAPPTRPPSTADGGEAPASDATEEPVPERPVTPGHGMGGPVAATSSGGTRALHERLPGSDTRMRGHAVAAPHATGLPRALEVTRALRPWKRPWPEGRRSALDIDATVDSYARSGELLPVFAAAPERWFDLALVVDRSPNMRVWEETLTDFTTVLDRLGAFRTLQVRDLGFDADGRPRAPGQLRRADGRRLVVVVSDCMAEPWRAPEVWQLLRAWAATTPMALLNPLPTKLWRRGGLNLPTVRFTPAAPGAHRSRLPHEAPPLLDLADPDSTGQGGSGAWLPIPVLSLSPHSLDRWSRAAMRGDPEGCTAVLVPPGGRLPGRPRPSAVPLPPGTVAKGFLRTAAPRAARLAVLCSPFDRLSLQLLHVIRRELVPEATTADVAEVVTSGLFELEQASDGDGHGPLELVLPDEARAVLRERLPAHEAWRVHQALDRHVASRGDGRARLPSVVRDPAGPQALPAEHEAFARASRQTLELLGLAVPEEAAGAPSGAHESRTAPSPRLPAPPHPFVGHTEAVNQLVARLSAPDGGVHQVSALLGSPGAGRTAFALHVAHRVREHYPDGQFYVDLRGSTEHPVPPEAALHRLLTDLGAPVDEGPHTADELAAKLAEALARRRVLLVLDDAPDWDEIRRLLPTAPGCAAIVTSRNMPANPVGREILLPPLRHEESHALLTSLVDMEGDEDRAALRGLTAGGAWWPLTLRITGSWIASGSAPPLPELRRMLRAARPAAAPAEPGEDLEAVLRLRLSHLPGRLLEAMRLLALAETGQLTREEASALLGTGRAAQATLDRLVTEGLLERPGADLYRMPEAVHRHVRRSAYDSPDAENATARLLRLHLFAAAALYERRRPGSRLAARLGVEPAQPWTSQGTDDVWLPNALALPTTADSPRAANSALLRRLADLLLLLQDLASSIPYRSRYQDATRSLITTWPGSDQLAHIRFVVALAHGQYAAGRPGQAEETLGVVARSVLEQDRATGGLTALLAGRLAVERGAPSDAVRDLEQALHAFRADDDSHGVATSCLELARVLTRLGRTGEAIPLAQEALGCFPDPGPSPLTLDALLCLEDSLAAARRYEELLTVQRRVRSQFRLQGLRRAEGQALTRIARSLLTLRRPSAAEAAAQEALMFFAGSEDPDGAEARRLLAAARSHLDGEGPAAWTVIAIEADGEDPDKKLRVLAPVIDALEAGGVLTPRHQRHWEATDDGCLLFVDPDVPLDPLLGELAARLPDTLEASGRRPAARLAVHTATTDSGTEQSGTVGPGTVGPGTVDPRAVDPRATKTATELDIRLAFAMLRSAEFRRISENFPVHPTFCVSPEAFGRLTRQGDDGLVAGRFVPREVTAASGEVVSVVLTPQVDLSAYDAELLMLARAFNDLDPDGSRTAVMLRECLDSALAPVTTGRFDPEQLDQRERARIRPELERALHTALPFTTACRLELLLGGREWTSPVATAEGLCLVVTVDDGHARWSAGLLRRRPGTPSAQARTGMLWLHQDAPLPENVLLRLAEEDRAAILAPASAADRAAELFRRVRGRPVRDAALRAVTRRRDSARRVREAAVALRDEGVLVLGGNRRGRELAAALRVPVPEADAYVSVRLARRRPHHTGPSVLAGGVAWVVAGSDDPVEPLPQDLPSPRRPR
ncbi:NaeI family type II restriction endonuclease [Streptomyces sp. TRM49041]|uniref:NaeI family type II restriction endonuclease n=1 Tax=Streptomyces sp. TRM49041 TaxID=2603216 RepID=UPI0011EDD0C6|nr:NaeI family type II restriction endonuclease [Streptomyces sp. TRM49041]